MIASEKGQSPNLIITRPIFSLVRVKPVMDGKYDAFNYLAISTLRLERIYLKSLRKEMEYLIIYKYICFQSHYTIEVW